MSGTDRRTDQERQRQTHRPRETETFYREHILKSNVKDTYLVELGADLLEVGCQFFRVHLEI